MGILHNDACPRNWLRNPQGQIKITDFGLSLFFRDLPDQDLYRQLCKQELDDVRFELGLWSSNSG